MQPEESSVLLTFDDGPIPGLTEEILTILKKFEVKATFFCVGDNIRKYPEIFKRIIKEGHSVGNHTFNHLAGWKTSGDDYQKNIELCEDEISHYGIQTKLFRPPYGKIKRSQIKQLISQGYKIVMWDVLSYDFHHEVSDEQCLNNSIKYTRPGSIIVFHDNPKAEYKVKYTLPLYIEYCLQAGLTFKKMEMKWN